MSTTPVWLSLTLLQTEQHFLMLVGLVLNHPGQVFKQSCASLPLSNYCVISLEDEVTMFQDRNKSEYCPTVDWKLCLQPLSILWIKSMCVLGVQQKTASKETLIWGCLVHAWALLKKWYSCCCVSVSQCCSWINLQTAFATLICCVFVVTGAQQAFILRYLLFYRTIHESKAPFSSLWCHVR